MHNENGPINGSPDRPSRSRNGADQEKPMRRESPIRKSTSATGSTAGTGDGARKKEEGRAQALAPSTGAIKDLSLMRRDAMSTVRSATAAAEASAGFAHSQKESGYAYVRAEPASERAAIKKARRPAPLGHSQFLMDQWEQDELLDLFRNAECRLGASTETAAQRAGEAVDALREYAQQSQQMAEPALCAWASRGAALWSDVRYNFRDRQRAANWIYADKMDALADAILAQTEREGRLEESDMRLCRFSKMNHIDEAQLVSLLRQAVLEVGKFSHHEAVKSAVTAMQRFVRAECALPYAARSEHCPDAVVDDFCELWRARLHADSAPQRGNGETVTPLSIFAFHKEITGFIDRLSTRSRITEEKEADEALNEEASA